MEAAGGSESLEVDLPHPWQNFLQPGDVNNDGSTTALDALRIVNELGRRQFSDSQTQNLDDPQAVNDWPGVYFDQNGDNSATALDALRVINEMARQTDSNQSAEGQLVVAASIETDRLEAQPKVPSVSVRAKSRLRIDGLAAKPSTAPISAATSQRDAVSRRDELIRHESVRDESIRAVDELLANESFMDQLLSP